MEPTDQADEKTRWKGPDVRTAGPRLLDALATIEDDMIVALVEQVAKYPAPVERRAEAAQFARDFVQMLLRVRREARRLKGARAAAETRRHKKDRAHSAIEAIRTERPRLGERGATALYLRRTKPKEWQRLSPAKRKTKVDSLTRKLRRIRSENK